MRPWLIAAIVIVVLLFFVLVALLIAKGNQDIATCIATAGLGAGGAMVAVGEAALCAQRQRDAEAAEDAQVLAAIGAENPELARLLKQIDADNARGDS